MNSFIVSSVGFFKTMEFDIDKKEHVIVWCHNLRDAKRFKNKAAVSLIEKHNINAFVWNPYKEEHITSKWIVVQRTKTYSSVDNDHKAFEFYPSRAVMVKNTDVEYLSSNGNDNQIYYDSYTQALDVCNVKNLEIIEELKEKMIKIQNCKLK